MPLNPDIALGVKPPEPFNPLQGLAQIGQIRAQQQEQLLRQQQIQSGQATEAERRQKTAKEAQAEADSRALYDILGQSGTDGKPITADAAAAQIQMKVPSLYQAFMKAKADQDAKAAESNKANQEAEKFKREAMVKGQEYAEPMMQLVEKSGYNPGVFDFVLNHVQGHFPEFPADQYRQAAQGGPEAIKAIIDAHKSTMQQNADTTAGTAAATSPKLAAETRKTTLEADQLESGTPKSGELDALAQGLYAKRASGQSLTPQETANLKGYEDRKRVVSDPALLAAGDRQAQSQNAQTAQQQRAQDFAQAQAGRAELTTKVEQPYLDAKEKAATLRGVIEAAKGGNMAAASVQSLLGTLGLVTMEGVKRINTTELQQVAGAGSLLERLKGSASRVAAGQPLSPKIQEDLTQLSNLLEQGATKKYQQGFDSVTKRYKLTDERPLTDTAPAGAGATGGTVEQWEADPSRPGKFRKVTR